MKDQRIYADLNKWEEVNDQFRVILTTHRTHQDLQRYDITLEEGLELNFWMDDEDNEGNPDPLYFQGIAHYDKASQKWVAIVVSQDIRNASELEGKTLAAASANMFDTLIEHKEVPTESSAKPKTAPKRLIKI